MKIVMVSDTHEQRPELPEGDVLIHAGDLTIDGKLAPLKREIDWLKSLHDRFAHVVFIGGNHDFALEAFMKENREDLVREMAAPAIYLRDSAVNIDGLKIHGSPWQPWFMDWAFNLQRGSKLAEKWSLIPQDTDILVTHGPPMYVLDEVHGDHVGCFDLNEAVARIRPKVHVFGHIHCAYGQEERDGTKFFNAAVVNVVYKLNARQKPFVTEIDK